MTVNCNIDEVIEFLKKKKEEGYQRVEVIDDARAGGWFSLNPKIDFIFCKSEPNVLGIDARTKK